MSTLDEEKRLKRGPSSPLSESEELEDPGSRRSRMKRINLTDLIEGQSLAPVTENANTGLPDMTPRTDGDAGDDSDKSKDIHTGTIPPTGAVKTPSGVIAPYFPTSSPLRSRLMMWIILTWSSSSNTKRPCNAVMMIVPTKL